jgi:alpha-tubulin suppressor-like RCC1 family protein
MKRPPIRATLVVAACLLAADVCVTATASAATGTQVKQWGLAEPEGYLWAPAAVPGLEEVVVIDAGNGSRYALEADGAVMAWGRGAGGDLGDGSKRSSAVPVRVAFPAGVKIVALGEAEFEAYAIDSTGQGWAWGSGDGGSLCLGQERKIDVPREVPGMTQAIAVQGGEHHVLWLLKNGTVEACGINAAGQLGVGRDIAETSTPLAVPGLSGVVEISAGNKSSAARTSSGAVYMWGSNLNGQIGIGSSANRVYTPSRVPLPGPASEISAGGDFAVNSHTVALVNGVPYGWGADQAGQVGDEEAVNKASPVLATAWSGLDLKQIVAGGESTFGLTAGGEVYGVGSDEMGVLGAGFGGYSLAPVLVDTGAAEVSATAGDGMDR